MAKVFKHGCTVINASGNWLDPVTHKLITEPSHVVICDYKKSQQMSKQIDSLRNWYVNKLAFQKTRKAMKAREIS